MKNKTQLVESQSLPTGAEIAKAIKNGLLNIKEKIDEIGKMIVLAIDSRTNGASIVYREIQEAEPSISYNMIATFEKVGRESVYSPVLLDSSPVSKKLLDLPFSQQKLLYDNPVKVVHQENGKNIVEEKRIQNLTSQEIKVVFSEGNHVRTVDEQIKFVSRGEPQKRISPAMRYSIEGNELVVLSNTRFKLSDLQSIVEKMLSTEKSSIQSYMKKNQIKHN